MKNIKEILDSAQTDLCDLKIKDLKNSENFNAVNPPDKQDNEKSISKKKKI